MELHTYVKIHHNTSFPKETLSNKLDFFFFPHTKKFTIDFTWNSMTHGKVSLLQTFYCENLGD